MKFRCPDCGTVGQIADWKIPVKGAYARCFKCQARFFVGADRRSRRNRRSGIDRRKALYSAEDNYAYFSKGGSERRSWADRRLKIERRANWPRVKKWSIAGGGLISRS